MGDAYKSWFGGKPAGTLTVGTKYVRLDNSKWDPKANALDLRLVYLNVQSITGTGFLRIRGVRADGDATGYHDYPILAAGQLITHVYYEPRGSKDGPTVWSVKCWGGLRSAKIATRYAKGAAIHKRP